MAYCGWPDGCERDENWRINFFFPRKIAKLESVILENPGGKKTGNDKNWITGAESIDFWSTAIKT